MNLNQLEQIPTDTLVDKLLDLDDDAFRRLVGDHLGPEEPARLWEAFTHPDLYYRTRAALKGRAGQMQAMRDNRQENRPWTPGRAGYLNLVNQRLHQLGMLRQDMHELHKQQRRDGDREALACLAAAVELHRLECKAAGMAPEPHDQRLWSLLEDLVVAEDGRTAQDMVRAGHWQVRPDEDEAREECAA
jgi:hypothetical protein